MRGLPRLLREEPEGLAAPGLHPARGVVCHAPQDELVATGIEDSLRVPRGEGGEHADRLLLDDLVLWQVGCGGQCGLDAALVEHLEGAVPGPAQRPQRLQAASLEPHVERKPLHRPEQGLEAAALQHVAKVRHAAQGQHEAALELNLGIVDVILHYANHLLEGLEKSLDVLRILELLHDGERLALVLVRLRGPLVRRWSHAGLPRSLAGPPLGDALLAHSAGRRWGCRGHLGARPLYLGGKGSEGKRGGEGEEEDEGQE